MLDILSYDYVEKIDASNPQAMRNSEKRIVSPTAPHPISRGLRFPNSHYFYKLIVVFSINAIHSGSGFIRTGGSE